MKEPAEVQFTTIAKTVDQQQIFSAVGEFHATFASMNKSLEHLLRAFLNPSLLKKQQRIASIILQQLDTTKRRIEIVGECAEEVLEGHLLEEVKSKLADASDINARRNEFSHGHIGASMETQSLSVIKKKVKKRSDGQVYPFAEWSLEELHQLRDRTQDLAHEIMLIWIDVHEYLPDSDSPLES